jgi:hypothetical protein
MRDWRLQGDFTPQPPLTARSALMAQAGGLPFLTTPTGNIL